MRTTFNFRISCGRCDGSCGCSRMLRELVDEFAFLREFNSGRRRLRFFGLNGVHWKEVIAVHSALIAPLTGTAHVVLSNTSENIPNITKREHYRRKERLIAVKRRNSRTIWQFGDSKIRARPQTDDERCSTALKVRFCAICPARTCTWNTIGFIAESSTRTATRTRGSTRSNRPS